MGIHIPGDLRFKDYNNNYELVGIFSHSGNAESGHYWFEVYSNNQWLKCNDSIIEPSQFDINELSTSATCLVYAIPNVFNSYKNKN